MFDDPKKELERLQDELLAEEDADWLEDDTDEELAQIKAMLNKDKPDRAGEDYERYFQNDYREEYAQEPFYRNYSNGYGTQVRNYANGYGRGMPQFAQEGPEEDMALYMDEDDRGDEQDEQPREKGIRGLIILACLETLGILAIVVWWILWLM